MKLDRAKLFGKFCAVCQAPLKSYPRNCVEIENETGTESKLICWECFDAAKRRLHFQVTKDNVNRDQ
jgi:hypothetical protein